jgi:hypothetical protein
VASKYRIGDQFVDYGERGNNYVYRWLLTKQGWVPYLLSGNVAGPVDEKVGEWLEKNDNMVSYRWTYVPVANNCLNLLRIWKHGKNV